MKILVSLVFTLVVAGCTVQINPGRESARAKHGSPADQAAVRATATTLLSHVDAGSWDTVWGYASQELARTTSADGFFAGVRRARSVFGAPKSRALIELSFPKSIQGAPPGSYGVAVYATDFTKAAAVEEQVVLVKEEGAWRLAGYWAEKNFGNGKQ